MDDEEISESTGLAGNYWLKYKAAVFFTEAKNRGP